MSYIRFKKIILDSFLSYDHEEVDIDNVGVAFIRGENNQDTKSESNGSGKSALISESLLWCFTGATSRNASEVKNLYLDRGASVIVHLEKDGNEYIIGRGTIGSKLPNGLSIIKNGIDMTKSRIKETTEFFENEFPELSWLILTQIVILTQGLVGGLSTLSNRDRKVKLEELSNVGTTYTLVQTLADNAVKRYTAKVKEEEAEKRRITALIDAHNKVIDTLTATIEQINETNRKQSENPILDSQIDDTKAELLKTQAEEVAIQESIAAVEKERNQLQTDRQNLTTEKATLGLQVQALQNTNAGIDSKIQALNQSIARKTHELEHIKDTECPVCHQAVDTALTDDLRLKLQTEIAELIANVADQTTQYVSKDEISEKYAVYRQTERKIDEIAAAITEIKLKLEDMTPLLTALRRKITTLNQELQQYMSTRNYKPESTESHRALIEKYMTENSVLKADVFECERRLAFEQENLKVATWINNQTPRAIRTFMLEGVVDFINMRCKEYSEYLFDDDVVQLKTDKSNLDIYLGTKQVENTSGGEHRRLDIVLQLAIRDLVMSEVGFSSNLLIIDEVFDHLDSRGISMVLDLIMSQKATVTSIFLITHKNDANIDYDDVLLIRKENNISRVIR